MGKALGYFLSSLKIRQEGIIKVPDIRPDPCRRESQCHRNGIVVREYHGFNCGFGEEG